MRETPYDIRDNISKLINPRDKQTRRSRGVCRTDSGSHHRRLSAANYANLQIIAADVAPRYLIVPF